MKKFNILFTLLSVYFSVFSQAPTITSFSPASGPVGTLITITGTNLNNPITFNIGGVAAIVVSDNGTSLRGMVMPGAVTGSVSVTTAGGTATGVGNFTIAPIGYQSTQQGPELVGTGVGATWASQGTSLALSADGNTAIVGGWRDSNDSGAAWIFTRSGSTWTQQGSKLVGTGEVGYFVSQGWSVGLSADGNTAIVGGYADKSDTGAAWIFTRSGSTWTQQGTKLVGTGAVGPAYQGYSVGLSADGNTAIMGGPEDSSEAGAAWIFTRSGSNWTQQGRKLVGTGATGGIGNSIRQGWSVALSADGNTAIVGGVLDDTAKGAAWIYTRSGSTWTQQGSKLVGTGSVGSSGQGYCVALSADGNTAILGGPSDSINWGAVWIFDRMGSTWSQQGSKLVGTGVVGYASQGISVAVSADGTKVLVGGYYDNNQIGAAWIYTRSGSTWTQQGNKLVGTGSVDSTLQGRSVALSADGRTALVGGPGNSATGGAWVFVTDTSAPCVSSTSSFSESICSGSSYFFNGQNLMAAGTYYDTLISSGGCDSVIVLHLTVITPLTGSYSHQICFGSSYSFGGQNVSAPGTYIDTMTSVISGCDSIVTLHLSVDSVNALFTLIPTNTPHYWDIVNQCSGNGLSYIWNWGDSSANSSGDTASHIYAAAGYYIVCVTISDSAGCTAQYCDTNVYLYKDQSGQMVYVNVVNYPNGIVQMVNKTSTIHLYPNPNRGSFTLQTSASIGSDYTISDMLGHVIIQRSIRSETETIELPDASEGVYTLAIKGAQPIRFVIVR